MTKFFKDVKENRSLERETSPKSLDNPSSFNSFKECAADYRKAIETARKNSSEEDKPKNCLDGTPIDPCFELCFGFITPRP